MPYIHYTKYCIDRLESFYDAYEACSQVLAKLNADIPNSAQSMLLNYITIDGSEQNIYEDLLGKYQKYMACISARKQYLQKQVSQLNTECESLEKQIGAIRDQCDMEKFLKKYSTNGTKLWEELCSFRREDIYKNENYIGQDMNETTLMENIDQLLKRAEEEIDKAREIHYTVSTTIGNLLLLPEFEPFWNKFELGNYIRIRVDEDIYKLRLISISCDYSDIAHLGVEFSDIVKERSAINDFKQIIQQANSVASSFNFVSRQAENGTKAQSAITTLLNEGLNVANTMIQDAKNQTFEMNEYGITGREWDDYSNEYKPEQIRIVNNLLCFTDDAWEHTRTALGKIWWKNEWRYGLLAEVLVGKVIAGEQLTIENTDGSVVITGDGINITNGLLYIKDTRKSGNTNISVEINPNGTNFTGHNEDYVFNVAKNDNIIMGVTNEGNGYFKGDITATSLTLENCKLPYSSISDTPTIPTDITELTGGSNIMYKGDVTREEKKDSKGNTYYTYTVPTESGNYTYDVYERDSYLVFGVGKGADPNDHSKSYTMVDKEGLLTAYNAIIYGAIYATKGEFSGKISATSGYIGNVNTGWQISEKAIFNDNMYIGTDEIRCSGYGNYSPSKITLSNGILDIYTPNLYTFEKQAIGIIIHNDLVSGHSREIYSNIGSGFIKVSDDSIQAGVGFIRDSSNEIGYYLLNEDNNMVGSYNMVGSFWTDGLNKSTLECSNIKCSNIDLIENGTPYPILTISALERPIIKAYQYAGTTPPYPYYLSIGGEWDHLFLDATDVHSNGTFYTPDGTISISDKRLKTDITDIEDEAIDFIMNLQPKKYKLKHGTSGRYHYGFVAQELEQSMLDTVGDVGILVKSNRLDTSGDSDCTLNLDDENTYYYGLRYEELISPMIKTIQKLNMEIKKLKEKITDSKTKTEYSN